MNPYRSIFKEAHFLFCCENPISSRNPYGPQKFVDGKTLPLPGLVVFHVQDPKIRVFCLKPHFPNRSGPPQGVIFSYFVVFYPFFAHFSLFPRGIPMIFFCDLLHFYLFLAIFQPFLGRDPPWFPVLSLFYSLFLYYPRGIPMIHVFILFSDFCCF